MKKVKWIKFVARPTPLLERYLRMWGIAHEFKQFKSTDVNNLLIVSENEVDTLYVDKKEHNNLPKVAYREFKEGKSRKILSVFNDSILDILENFQKRKKIKIKEDNFKQSFHDFVHFHGLGWAIVWYYHTCNRIFPEIIKRELVHYRFKKPINELLAILFTPLEIEQKFSKYFMLNKKEIENKKRLLSTLKINKSIQEIIEHMATISYLHEVADRVCSNYFEYFIDELSKKVKTSPQELNQYLPQEIEKLLLLQKKISVSILKSRRCFYVLKFQKGRTYLFLGKKAEKIAATLEKEKELNVKTFKGQVASVGYAKGKAVIVKSMKDITKINEGDILVSPMTTPRMLPAMKKAIAFVTDEGGITCHAAITARELKKPCIIGTKIATQILKDGDMVEVNANTGIVSILK